MINEICQICGGCPLREMEEQDYRQQKQKEFERTIGTIKAAHPQIEKTIFIGDGNRRRAEMDFKMTKGKLCLGFNESKSHNLVDIENCPMLLPEINNLLPEIKEFLHEFCSITPTSVPAKKKKQAKTSSAIKAGSIQMLYADNGMDILLKLTEEPVLEHRLLVGEFVNKIPNIIRLSWSIGNTPAETIVEKVAPELYIAGYAITIPQGVFLQASKASETAMIAKVMEYMGDTTGKIADLFCGLGTFTYPLAKNKKNDILSVDSSSASLQGLQKALNRNQIQNVEIKTRNLFKDPLDETELKGVRAIVIDPPRAGAHEQCRKIVAMPQEDRPEKIVFVSCNPQTFVYDATLLAENGYEFEKVVMVDQFVYSPHQELIALVKKSDK